MNAVLASQPSSANRYAVSFSLGDAMDGLLPELRSDVRHIQSDVTDIKASARDTNAGLEKLRDKLDDERKELGNKIDALSGRFDVLSGRFDALSGRFDALHRDVTVRIDGINGKFDEQRKELSGKIEETRKEAAFDNAALREEILGIAKDLGVRIDAVKDSIAKAKVWALMLYITLAASTFTLVARAFKWI